MSKRILRVINRRGRQLTVADDAGQEHQATLAKLDAEPVVREEGSFAFGYCKSCDWTGPARRARAKAVDDATSHLSDCPGQPKVRLGVAQD